MKRSKNYAESLKLIDKTKLYSAQEAMEKVIEAIRGCTVDCFEGCEEKGVIYGVGLSDVGDAEKKPEFMATAYEMGKNC